jgi:hypothetical protein
MKRTAQTHIWIIAFLAIIGFTLTACNDKPEKEKTVSGTVIANEAGEIMFKYTRSKAGHQSCLFTTDLASPNDQFTLAIASGKISVEKVIDGLESGQKVTWKAKVDGHPLNHGSGHNVHIINDD